MYFSQDYTPHDHRFLEALAGSENQVHYLRLEDRGRQLEVRPTPSGIDSIDWWGGRRQVRWWDFPRARRELRNVLERVRPDLVHAGPLQGPALLTAATGFRPLVSMSWGSDLLVGARQGFGKWAAGFALARSEVLICDSQAVQDRALRLGMRSGAVVRFPWGVDLQHFVPDGDNLLRQQLGWGDRLVLISTRAWEPMLGVDQLVHGFIQAAHQIGELRLLLLGTGSMEAELRSLIATTGMQDRIHHAGQVEYEELPSYYRAADLYISASHSDGSSVSLMEAMACGLPALVSDIPGNREWVEPEVNGWWFQDGNTAGMVDQLVEIAGRREQLAAMRIEARRIAETRADWSVNSGRIFQAYEQAVREAAA